MGSNCSCFHGNTDEKHFPDEFLLPAADQKLYSGLPQEAASSTLDIQVDVPDLTRLQSLVRGYLDRFQMKNFNSLKFNPIQTTDSEAALQSIPPSTNGQVINEIPMNQLPDYLRMNPSTSKVIEQLGPFVFESNSKADLISRGPVIVEAKAIYIGQWSQEEGKEGREGNGAQYWPDGSVYEGSWVGDKANGKGRLIHANGDVYEGMWENGRASGLGVYIHHFGNQRYKDLSICGARYEGMWKNDKQHGKGVETWPDGSRYEGLYEAGLKHGKGRFEWAEGSVYDGEFFKYQIQGLGTYYWNDGRIFTGTWKNGRMNGQGVFTWIDGRRYDGEYVDDKKHGFGVFTWKDGRKYEGYWHSGKQDGQGMYTSSNGIAKQGIWQKGKKIHTVENQ